MRTVKMIVEAATDYDSTQCRRRITTITTKKMASALVVVVASCMQ